MNDRDTCSSSSPRFCRHTVIKDRRNPVRYVKSSQVYPAPCRPLPPTQKEPIPVREARHVTRRDTAKALCISDMSIGGIRCNLEARRSVRKNSYAHKSGVRPIEIPRMFNIGPDYWHFSRSARFMAVKPSISIRRMVVRKRNLAFCTCSMSHLLFTSAWAEEQRLSICCDLGNTVLWWARRRDSRRPCVIDIGRSAGSRRQQ